MGGIAVNGSHVYWAASSDFSAGDGAIWEANLDGTGAQSIVPGRATPADTQRRSRISTGPARCPLDSQPGRHRLDDVDPGPGQPSRAVVDGTRIYWTNIVENNGTVNESNMT